VAGQAAGLTSSSSERRTTAASTKGLAVSSSGTSGRRGIGPHQAKQRERVFQRGRMIGSQ
jgi:hypothetical protein